DPATGSVVLQHYGGFELIEILPAKKRRFSFQLIADIQTEEAISDFQVMDTREFTAGEVDPPEYLFDPMKLAQYGKYGDTGVAEWSYKNQRYEILAFRARGNH